MPAQLLPASAAAFAPRASSVNVVLGSKVEPWLTQTLKRINKVKRPLNSVPQHQRCLTETLSSKTAIWNLSALMLPKVASARCEDENPLVEAMFNYELVHIEAYIVHVDMVLRNEVAFKLTPDTIEILTTHHKEVHCQDAADALPEWPEKDAQIKKLHADFVQAINRYVYRTPVAALEGLEEDGMGELLCGKSDEVKTGITDLFLPLVQPTPKIVEVIPPPNHGLPNSPEATWWNQPSIPSDSPSPVDPWRIVPSSSPQTSSTAMTSPELQMETLWPSMSFGDVHLSPQPAFSNQAAYSTASMFYSMPPVMAPIPTLPLPSMHTHSQCGMGLGFHTFGSNSSGLGGFGGFGGWERVGDNYATTM